jgi:hypothetical protein
LSADLSDAAAADRLIAAARAVFGRDWLKIGGEWINRVNFGSISRPEWTRGMDFTVGANRR